MVWHGKDNYMGNLGRVSALANVCVSVLLAAITINFKNIDLIH